jgi:hypothetical protein
MAVQKSVATRGVKRTAANGAQKKIKQKTMALASKFYVFLSKYEC